MSDKAQAPLTLNEFASTPYEVWKKEAELSLKGAPFEKKLITKTVEGIDLQPLYTQEMAATLGHLENTPGAAPYIRSTKALGSRVKSWDVAQEIPYGSVKEFNTALRNDLDRGQSAVNLSLDRAARLGLDPDQAKAGDVGQCGLSIAHAGDLARALEGVDFNKVPLYIQAGASGLAFAALLGAVLKKRQIKSEVVTGVIETDPLGEWVVEGKLPLSLESAYRELAAVTAWAAKDAPKLQTIGVRGNPYHDSGANAVQELAFAMATGVEYIRGLGALGLDIDTVAPRIHFSLSVGSQHFTEIAKFRAARWLWSKIVSAFGGSAESQKITLHARTSLWNKTVYDPYVNMLRATNEAFAAVLGGCDSLHVGAFDEVVRPPDEFSRRIARNTQLILRDECQLDKVVDPAGGSWYVETLTRQLSEKAWELFQEIEKQGGMAKALAVGVPQNQITALVKQRVDGISKRRDVQVGINQYANATEKPLPVPATDCEAVRTKRAKQLQEYRTSSEHTIGTDILEKLASLLNATPTNVLPAAIDAAAQGATLGEITRTLRAAAVPTAEIPTLRIRRLSESIESLRVATEAYKAKNGGKAPQVFLATMGSLKQHKARADFSTGFVRVGGFDVITPKGFATPNDAATAALESGAQIVVICSTDETYPEIVPALTAQIKKAKPNIMVIVAGYPTEQIESFKQAGVDDFIHIKADCYQVLSNLQKKTGVTA